MCHISTDTIVKVGTCKNVVTKTYSNKIFRNHTFKYLLLLSLLRSEHILIKYSKCTGLSHSCYCHY